MHISHYLKALFIFMIVCAEPLSATPLLIGYFSNWAQFRPKPGNCLPEDLNPIVSRLTDIHYAYLYFNYNTQTQFSTNDWKIQFTEVNDSDLLTRVVSIAGGKSVYVCIGGWNFNDPYNTYGQTTYPYFSEMVADSTKYNPFIQSAITLCQQYNLAGVCLEWLFPGVPSKGGTNNDYQNLTNFIKTFSSQMSAQGFKVRMAVPGCAPANFINGFAVVADPTTQVYSINSSNAQTYIDWLSALSQYVDLFYVMGYDYFGPDWQPGNGPDALPLTGENAPLQPNPTITQVNNNPTCITETIHAYTTNVQYPTHSMPANKIVLGVPAYGRTFRGLKFPGNLPNQPFGPGAEFTDPDTGGYYTKQPGFLAYYEIKYNLCNYYKHAAVNSITSTAYAWSAKNLVWTSYDNAETAKSKGQYALNNGLLGAGVWTLDDDNFFDDKPFTITNGVADGLGLP